MTKSRRSSKNSINPVLLFSLIISLAAGCSAKIEPTYKEKEIPYLVQKICREEYKVDVRTRRAGSTLWVYAPLQKILHKEFGIKEDKIFDEDVADKLRNILTTVGRVLISSDNTPEFFGLVASDINLGFDYTIIGNVLDIKKSYAGFIPWTEANRRYVIKFNIEPAAIGDSTAKHVKFYNIALPNFLAEQITQRIGSQFQEENLKNYFKVEKVSGNFENGAFLFEYLITQLKKPKPDIDIKKEVLKTITYCVKTYDFKDFSGVAIVDLLNQNKTDLNQKAILSAPSD